MTRTQPPSADMVASVDFDGTIAPWGRLFSSPPPLPEAAEAVRALKKHGYTIYIFTSRLSPSWHAAEGRDPKAANAQHRRYLAKYLKTHDIPFDAMGAEKIPAAIYFDDKAMRVSTARPLSVAVTDFLQLEGDPL